ncbi:MAG TPA: PA domain-containing protein, partial [Gaiellaceae bacterium]|nr:PA domain-containing protein [Gaiellaceae bacterium]
MRQTGVGRGFVLVPSPRRSIAVVAVMLLAALVMASVAGARTIKGTAKANTLRGTSSADVILGLGGADRLYGARGNDKLAGGSGRDVIRCGAGRDSVLADGADRVAADCERVSRLGAPSDATSQPSEAATQPASGAPAAQPGGPSEAPPAQPPPSDTAPGGGQHGEDEGHLLGDGAWGKIEYLGNVRIESTRGAESTEDLVADVAVSPDGEWAFLANWGEASCADPSERGGRNAPDAGAWVIDISGIDEDSEPVEPGEASPTAEIVEFIPSSQDSRPGEGMHVIELTTSFFTGNVLVMNNEMCGPQGKGGVSLWDVTDPTKPKKLSEHFGDRSALIGDVNTIHSAFAWDAGDRAYVVMNDNEEFPDVDILDITNPHRPRLIAEYDLNDFGVSQPDIGLTDSFLHDMVVKQIDGRFIMLLSYWDGGFVLLDVTDPANAVFLGDSEFTNPDPELLQEFGAALTPEGNAHQAEFTIDNRFVIGTDEDFAPFRLNVITNDGNQLHAKLGTNTTLDQALDIAGQTVFVGRACPGDTVPAGTGDQIAVVERGDCFFTEKVASILAAGGYEAVVIMNREGPDACVGVFEPSVEGDIPVIFVGRDAGFALFDMPFDNEACLEGDESVEAQIAIGTRGDTITNVEEQFDGWGYVHLFDFDLGANSATLTEL